MLLYRRVSLGTLFLGLALSLNVHAAPKPKGKAPKILAVVAHPDDEYCFAATLYRITKELGGTVDQVVITNGEGGYKYSLLAEKIYGVQLTQESVGRAHLPAIRKAELKAAGAILGVRRHTFLDEKDLRYTKDVTEALDMWNMGSVKTHLEQALIAGKYDYVFTLLPTPETHGHHKAATLSALEAVSSLPQDQRPIVLGCASRSQSDSSNDDPIDARGYEGLPGFPLTEVSPNQPILTFDRTQSFGFKNNLSYEIVVSWMISEHKSQGYFQTYHKKHAYEDFRVFDLNGSKGTAAARTFFKRLNSQE